MIAFLRTMFRREDRRPLSDRAREALYVEKDRVRRAQLKKFKEKERQISDKFYGDFGVRPSRIDMGEQRVYSDPYVFSYTFGYWRLLTLCPECENMIYSKPFSSLAGLGEMLESFKPQSMDCITMHLPGARRDDPYILDKNHRYLYKLWMRESGKTEGEVQYRETDCD